jgi:AbrB family looped-hinge helix DNA binding protein
MVTMVEFKLNVSDKGQILIPKVLRDRYGVKEGELVLVEPTNDGLLLKRRPTPEEVLEALRQHIAKLRKAGIKGPRLGELKTTSLEMEFEEKVS